MPPPLTLEDFRVGPRASNKMKPISPSQVTEAKLNSLPDEVIEAFNEMIVEKWDGSSAVIVQKEIVTKIVAKFSSKQKRVTRDQLFERHWLDVEDIFRKAGWKVVYDKPGFNESYEASFTFSKKR